MTNYLIIDGNSIGYGAQSMSKLTVGGEEVQAVYGFIKSLQKLLKDYSGYKPIVLWDGRAQWRFDLFPLYKGNREPSPDREAYKKQKPLIQKALLHLGVVQITDRNAEADDLAGYFSRKLGANESNEILLITGDKDWCQLVAKNVEWKCIRTDRNCSMWNFKEFTGVESTNQFVELKALTGDTSDNIPGVGGIGDVGALQLLKEFGDVGNFIRVSTDLLSEGRKLPAVTKRFVNNEAPADSPKYGKMLPMKQAFERNMNLMRLDNYVPNKSSLRTVGNGDMYSKERFKELCEDLVFKSILIQLDTWVAPFERLAGK